MDKDWQFLSTFPLNISWYGDLGLRRDEPSLCSSRERQQKLVSQFPLSLSTSFQQNWTAVRKSKNGDYLSTGGRGSSETAETNPPPRAEDFSVKVVISLISADQCPSQETNTAVIQNGQEIFHLSWNPRDHYSVHTRQQIHTFIACVCL